MGKKTGKFKIFVVIILIFVESAFSFSEKNIWNVLSYGFFYMDFSGLNSALQSFMRIVFPQIVLLFLWGNYFEENICKNADILFSRTRKCWKILGKSVGKLMLCLNCSCIGILVAVSTLYLIRGYHVSVEWKEILGICLFLLYMDILILLVNVISIFLSAIVGTFLVMLLQIVSLYFFSVLGNSIGILWILPTTTMKILQEPIREGLIGKEMMCLCGWFVVIFMCASRLLRKKEWL